MKNIKKLTEEQATKLYESNFWMKINFRERVLFQLLEDRLCMPFYIFHEAVERSLGRSVWTHQFLLNCDTWIEELLKHSPMPSFEEIINPIFDKE